MLIFTDNQALLGALRKGRSSVKSMNNIRRRVACLLLVANLETVLYYVKSELNPADGPSRFA